jgi:hypothetical protein
MTPEEQAEDDIRLKTNRPPAPDAPDIPDEQI